MGRVFYCLNLLHKYDTIYRHSHRCQAFVPPPGCSAHQPVKYDTGWGFCSTPADEVYAATISLPPQIAWKLFLKSIRPDDVIVKTEGDPVLARSVWSLVAVMA
jgi:hypothetical protein